MFGRYGLSRHEGKNNQQQEGHVKVQDVHFHKLQKDIVLKYLIYITGMSYNQGYRVHCLVCQDRPQNLAKTKTLKS